MKLVKVSGMKPVDSSKKKTVDSNYVAVNNVNKNDRSKEKAQEEMFLKKVRYLYEPGEAEGDSRRRATDPIWSTKIYSIKSIVPGNPTIYYLWNGPQRSFVYEELQVVPADTVTRWVE